MISSTITVEALHLLVVLFALVALSFVSAWVMGMRAERAAWLGSCRERANLTCEGAVYRVEQLETKWVSNVTEEPVPRETRRCRFGGRGDAVNQGR